MTKVIEISGKASWARLTPKSMDTKYGDKFTVNVSLDQDQMEKLREVGWRGKVKQDDLGESHAKFSRNNVQQFGDKEEKLGPPKLYMADRKTLYPEETLIANSSDITLLLEIYESKKYGVGSRILSIVIDNLIPFIPVARDPSIPLPVV